MRPVCEKRNDVGSHGTNRSSQPVSRPLVAVALTAILAVACVVVWMRLGDRIAHEATTTVANGCLEGKADVAIIADPGVAPALQQIAEHYNATKPEVRDRCVQVSVRPGDARATLDAVAAPEWNAESGGGARPTAWIPESSVWVAALQESAPAALQGAPDSLVQSPVLYAVRPELAVAAGGRVMWIQMPFLTYANAFEAYGHTAISGSARLAMPNGPQSDATALAAQAYAYNTADPQGPLTAREVSTFDIVTGLKQVVHAPPRVGDGSAEAAVRAIANAPSLAAATVRSVPISEQRLFLATRKDRKARVATIRPRGATPVLDYPVVRLAQETPAYASDTIAEFVDFVRKPEQMTLLTQSGFRGPGPLPKPTATVDFPALKDLMPTAEPAAAVAVSRIVLPAAAP